MFLPLIADLTKNDKVKTAINTVVEKLGRIDYAVNNAGIGQPDATTPDTTAEDFDRVLGVNLKGVWHCERLQLDQMVTQDPLPSVSGV